jgi:hypothetical protein
MSNSESLIDREDPQTRNPAKELIYYLLARHKWELHHLKPDQTLELFCYFDGFGIIPDSIGAINDSTIHIEVLEKVKDGVATEKRDWFVPIQKLSVRLDVRPKTDNKPPKEIGFHAIAEQLKEV